mgnify:CR=1 FL=1
MRKVSELVARVQSWFCGVLLGFMVVVVFLQVLSRRLFRVAMLWTQEAALFCFIWTVFLGAALAVKRGSHFVVDVWPERLVSFRRALGVFSFLVVGVVAAVLLREGWILTLRGWMRFSQPSGLRMSWFLAAIPVGGALMLLHMVAEVAELIAGKRLRKERPQAL